MDVPAHSASWSRRGLLLSTGKGVLAAGAGLAAAHLAGCSSPTRAGAGVSGTTPPATVPRPQSVTLPETLAKTEREQGAVPTPYAPDGRIGYAVVGLGRLTLHEILPALAQCKRSRLVALVSGDRDKARRVAYQYGIAESCLYDYTTFDRVAENPAVQVVYIVLPNSLHAEFTVRAARAGKHVLCEKPMATTVADAQRMIDACRQAERQLMIAYRLQYEPTHRELIRLVRAGELGEIRVITADNGQNLGDPAQWRLNRGLAGGGPLPDVGIYCINAARYLTGLEPLSVSARSFTPPGDARFREVEASLTFQLQFPQGILVTGSSSYAVHERRFLSVMGSSGWAQMDAAFTYRGLRLSTGKAEGERETITRHELAERNHFALEMDHLSRCLQEGVAPHTGGEEGLQDLRIIEALYRSAATDGAPVAMSSPAKRDATRGPEPAAADA